MRTREGERLVGGAGTVDSARRRHARGVGGDRAGSRRARGKSRGGATHRLGRPGAHEIIPGDENTDADGDGDGDGDGAIRIRSVPSPGTIPGTERALVLHRYWKRVELGVSANFLFNFSTRETTRRGARTLVHVDTSRRAVECYVPRKNTRGYPAMVLRRSFEVRDVATPREPRESNPRASLLVSAGAGSSARGAIFARFVFDTVADRSVFETLVGDLRAGRYRDADDYHLRGVLKRGWEGGEGWTPPRPERYLALVPGKLLALPSHVAAIPSDAVSLAEGAEVIVRAGKSRAPRGDEDEDGALALVEVTAGGTRRSFRMPNVAAASAWARAIRDAVPRDRARVKRVPEGEVEGENATTEADAAAPAPSGNDASSPASIGESIPPVVASSPSPPASPRGFEFGPSPRRRWSFPANSHEDEFSAKVEPANDVDARLAAMEARVALAEAAAAEASSRATAERDARLRVEAETRARAEADAAAAAEAEARRERAKLAAEAEAREAFARAEARAEARLAEEFEARAAALAAELDADARERAGVEEATRARAAAQAKLRAAEDARVVAAAEDEARRLESFRIAEEAKRRVESESAAQADARAKMEARVEAEERAAAAERAAANASSRAAAEKAEAIRKVKEENEHRVRVRERLRAEEEARVSAEEEAREVIRARAEADETRRMASLAARRRAEADEQARRRRAGGGGGGGGGGEGEGAREGSRSRRGGGRRGGARVRPVRRSAVGRIFVAASDGVARRRAVFRGGGDVAGPAPAQSLRTRDEASKQNAPRRCRALHLAHLARLTPARAIAARRPDEIGLGAKSVFRRVRRRFVRRRRPPPRNQKTRRSASRRRLR